MIARRKLLAAFAGTAASLALKSVHAESSVDLKPELAQIFADAGTQGTFAALDLRQDKLIMTDETRSRRGELPASTFKIPHSLIALETGVVADVDQEIIRWDGVVRSIPEWNKDHNLRSAVKYSVVPVFQQIARRIGAERMKQFVESFDYGNRNIGGAPIDRFWLSGDLRITPLEQIAFLKRLYKDDLPVKKRNLDLVKDIIVLEKSDQATIRGKTGAVAREDKLVLGWIVGWVEHGEEVVFFALNLDLHDGTLLARRLPMVKTLLGKMGLISLAP